MDTNGCLLKAFGAPDIVLVHLYAWHELGGTPDVIHSWKRVQNVAAHHCLVQRRGGVQQRCLAHHDNPLGKLAQHERQIRASGRGGVDDDVLVHRGSKPGQRRLHGVAPGHEAHELVRAAFIGQRLLIAADRSGIREGYRDARKHGP